MLSPDEVEHLAENTLVSMVPNFRHARMYLISGDFGPFEPAVPVSVPLWLAVNLRDRGRCRLVAPDWMNVERLSNCRDEETAAPHFTQPPHAHYLEMTQLLLNSAADDIPQADQIRTLVKDIWDVRTAKLRSSIDAFLKADASYAKLDHVTAIELNTVRPLLNHSLDQLYRLKRQSFRNISIANQQQQQRV